MSYQLVCLIGIDDGPAGAAMRGGDAPMAPTGDFIEWMSMG
jgi:hypothetical protein